MGKGSNLQKKQAARAKHEKEANKPQGGGGQAGKASRTGANAPKVYCHICRVGVFPVSHWIDGVHGFPEQRAAPGTCG